MYVLCVTGTFLLFRLYLSTAIDNPHILASIYNFVTVINFAVTFQGLEDQLLSTVVTHQVPHLESQRHQLLQSISLDTVTLEELDEKTLDLLENAPGKSRDGELAGDLFGRSEWKVMRLEF